MASESDTEEFYDAPEDVHLGTGYPVGSPGKVGLLSFKEAENTANQAGNESPVQELRQDVSKKILLLWKKWLLPNPQGTLLQNLI